MVRREFLNGLCASGAAVGLTACGGGSGGSTPSTGTGTAPPPPPAPAPAPAPSAPPAPSPTLRGITIEQAQADIVAPLSPATSYFDAQRATTDITVSSADEFQAAVTRHFESGAFSTHQRILCAWNGASTRSGGVGALIMLGRSGSTTGHVDAGGSLVIAAASGYQPDFANTVMIYGRGIKFQGIGFTRKAQAGERTDSTSAVVLARTGTYPVNSYVAFDDCAFGARTASAPAAGAAWANGLSTDGQVAEQILIRNCRFIGLQNAVKIVAKALCIEGCDFQAILQDCIALYGHTFETGYYAHAWISRTTFRGSPADWGSRSNHSDTIQTGTEADRHLGYRVLVTDVFSHLGRHFTGEAHLGGGTQGFYNDDHLTADNQFVVRRSVFLVTAPHGFCYYSPRASRPSFVDQSVFTRAGHVPSAFAPDFRAEDYPVGITGTEPAGGPWLLVTDTIAKNMMETNAITVSSIDPRVTSLIPAGERPETIFSGRDFGRGNAAVNGIADKFGYALPNETGSQARFVADVWANFQPQASFAGKGTPRPTSLPWAV